MKTWSSFLVLIFISVSLMAQPDQGVDKRMGKGNPRHHMGGGIPGLTDEQSKKMDVLRLTFQKEKLALENQMAELKAHQQTLSTAEKADMKAIYSNIDEITKLQNQMMKKSADYKQQIRSLLTDEQRLFFDTKNRNKKDFRGKDRKMFGQKGMKPGGKNKREGEKQTKELL
jgi:Spy/CpxP family protein refolding chaperone